MLRKYTTKVIRTIATSPEGIVLVNFGKKYMISIVIPTTAYILIPCPSKNLNCAIAMTIAKPLTKPYRAG